MINRMVPMTSPFLNNVRRSEQLWMLKRLASAIFALGGMPAMKAGITDHLWGLDEVMALLK
jgi:hypothetical protein